MVTAFVTILYYRAVCYESLQSRIWFFFCIMTSFNIDDSPLHKPPCHRYYLVRSLPGVKPWYVIHPNSTTRITWDCLTILAVLAEMCVSPLHLYRLDKAEQDTADMVQLILTPFWFGDMCASFLTATYIHDTMCFELKRIASAYLRSWFLFDICMLIPDALGILVEIPGL